MLRVTCPDCGARLTAPDHVAGEPTRCCRCRAFLRLSGGAGEESVAAKLPPGDEPSHLVECALEDGVEAASASQTTPPAIPPVQELRELRREVQAIRRQREAQGLTQDRGDGADQKSSPVGWVVVVVGVLVAILAFVYCSGIGRAA